MSRPAKSPRWADAPDVGLPGAVEPNEGKKDDGWDHEESPPAGEVNWILKHHADWIRYLDQEQIPAKEIAYALANWRRIQPGSATAVLARAAVMYRELTTSPPVAPTTRQHVIAVGVDGANTYAIGSSDGGNTWAVPTGLPAGTIHQCCIAPAIEGEETNIVGIGLGDSGLWVMWLVGSTAACVTGTIPGGAATINDVIYDHVNNYVWAATSQGLFRGAITNETTITWVLVSTVMSLTHVRVLDSGRVICYRPSDDRFYYKADPANTGTSPVAGVVLGSSGSLIGMETVGADGVVALDTTGNLRRSTDGTALSFSANGFFASNAPHMRKFRGSLIFIDGEAQALRTLPVYSDAVAATGATAATIRSLIAMPLNAVRIKTNHGLAAVPSRTSDRYIWLSNALPDITGAIAP